MQKIILNLTDMYKKIRTIAAAWILCQSAIVAYGGVETPIVAASNINTQQFAATENETHDPPSISPTAIQLPEVKLESAPFSKKVKNEEVSIDISASTIDASQERKLTDLGVASLADATFPSLKSFPLRNAAVIKTGSYIAKDYFVGGNFDVSAMEISLSDGNYSISGIYNMGDKVPLNVNLENGTVSIDSQKLFNNSTYGDVYIYPINIGADGSVTYTTQPVEGTVNESGVITMQSWGLIARGGTYDNRLLLAVKSSVWTPANARMDVVKNDGTQAQWPLLIEQNSSSLLTVYNFASGGAPVKMRLDANKKVSISPQYVLTYSLYGDFYCYSVTISGTSASISQINPIMGQGSDKSITLNPWIISAQSQPTLSMLFTQKSEITTDFKIEYPEKINADFEGAGTSASPYIIKTPAQLVALSQSVGAGNGYYGKFFALDADINMAEMSSQFTPVGSDETPFAGNFSGRGHTISNLTIDAVAYNYQGLFGALYGNVNDLRLDNYTITGSGYYLGGIAGWSQGEISDCSVTNSNINTTALWVGAIVGRTYNKVYNCSSSGIVKGYGYVGGLIGQSFHEINDCYSSATVEVDGYLNTTYVVLGGIAGLAQSYSVAYESKVTNCYFTGKVIQSVAYGASGGLVGFLYASSMTSCFNTGSVTTTSSVGVTELTGGLVGNIRDSKMTDCYNAGTVKSAGQGTSTGGLIGYLNCVYTTAGSEHLIDNNTITNCYNSGMVLAQYRTTHAGVYGDEFVSDMFPGLKPSDTAFTNALSDNQATGLYDTQFGHNTDYFTGTTLPADFKTSVWNAGNGLYPTLKAFDANEASALSSAAMHFASGQGVEVMKSNASLQAPASVKWAILNGAPTNKTVGLTLSGNSSPYTLSLTGQYANDTIVAYTTPGVYTRYYIVNAVPAKFQGEGTEKSPYLINNVADFILFNEAVQHYNHRGDYFSLTSDVDFNYSPEFAGVGAGNHLRDFAGTFNGNGHTISRLRINSYITNSAGQLMEGSYNYGGLFHILSPTSVVKNVTIAADCDFNFYNFSGAIAGEVSGEVSNCINHAVVKGVGSIGGIVGMTTETGIVKNCYNSGAVAGSSRYAGGIVGYSLGSISGSQNDADVTNSANYAGGIAGVSAGSISNSYNSGRIEAGDYCGGIVGSNSAGTGQGDVWNCVSTGIASGSIANPEYCGALIGWSNGRGRVADNYFDRSVNLLAGCSNLSSGITGLFTTQMIHGNSPDALTSEVWAWGGNLYPALKQFADMAPSKASRSIYVDFAIDQVRGNVVKNVPLSPVADITWTLANNQNFKLEADSLCVTIPTAAMAEDVLTATIPGLFTKVYPLRSAPVILPGNGTFDSPYLISSHEDLDTLAAFIAVSKMDYDGYHFRVESDIAFPEGFAAKTLSPTGVNFNADFNGNGHTISGYNIEATTSTTGKYLGFISTVGPRGKIRNLTLNGHLTGYNYSGNFAGKLYGSIENCVNLSTIETKSTYCGGFVGTAYDGSKIVNCINKGDVQPNLAMSYAAGIVSRLEAGAHVDSCANLGAVGNFTKNGTYEGIQYVAGIANWSAGKITNSYNSGIIKSRGYTAGIVSSSQLKDSIINCYNTSDLIVNGTYVGGIVAATVTSATANTAYIGNCYNTGTIQATGNVGGVGGYVQTGHLVENCYNTADVSCISTTNGPCGGVFGIVAGTCEVHNCYNSGNVSSTVNNCGGFGGRVNNTLTEDCHNTGNVTAKMEKLASSTSGVGGFAGSACGAMNRVWNSGNVVSNVPGCAGISGVGAMPIAKLNNCVNLGNVTCDTVVTNTTGSNNYFYYVGGIWAGYGPCQITNSYNAGTITGPSNVGGINAAMCFNANGGSIIENCYNIGKLVATKSNEGCSNIATFSSLGAEKQELFKVSNSYYDNSVNPVFPADTIAIGLSSQQMLTAPLGDDFMYQQACFPTLAFMADNAKANVEAAYILLSGSDTPDALTSAFVLGKPGNVQWSVSPNLSIDGNNVLLLSKGDAWVKASCEGYEKTIPLYVKSIGNGVDSISLHGELLSVTVYDLKGMPVAVPEHGHYYIVKTLYQDGTMKVDKMLWTSR